MVNDKFVSELRSQVGVICSFTVVYHGS